MTVKELIEHLSNFAPGLKVMAWDFDLADYEEVVGSHAEDEYLWLKTEKDA